MRPRTATTEHHHEYEYDDEHEHDNRHGWTARPPLAASARFPYNPAVAMLERKRTAPMAPPTYRRPDNIVFREEEDGAILFNADDGSVFLLEELGWALYHNHLDKGATRDEMLASLAEHYPDVPPETLAKDLDAYLADLEKAACVVKEG